MKSTSEHTASASVNPGWSQYGQLSIWDAIRAIDYLASRVTLMQRKLVALESLARTLTEYLMRSMIALVAPPRAVPSTTFERRVHKNAPGDAEQNIFGQIAFGLDHADYIHLRAPKPTLLLCAHARFRRHRGIVDDLSRSQADLCAVGYSERIDLLEADEEHGFPQTFCANKACVDRRWLMGRDRCDGRANDRALTGCRYACDATADRLQLLADARSVMDLNLDVVAAAEPARRRLVQTENRVAALETVRRRVGARRPAELPVETVEQFDRIERDGY